MSEHSVRIVDDPDPERFARTDHTVWFDEVGSESVAVRLSGVPADQLFAAETDDSDPQGYAGIYAVRPLALAAPDPQPSDPAAARLVPAAGITWVGVHPDHRRGGVLTAMMEDHLRRSRESGLALSALHASEPRIYGRFGYGLASTEATVTLARGTELTAPGLDEAAAQVRTRLTTAGDPGLAERLRACELRCAASAVGSVVPWLGFYDRILAEPPESLRNKESLRVLFATIEGVDVGLAAFRRTHHWENGRPGGELEVSALAGTPSVRLALLRRLLDFDLMATVVIPQVGPDDALWHWIGPRGDSKNFVCDSLWLRILDVPTALTQRRYAGTCDLVINIIDDHLVENAGHWRVVVRDGSAEVVRTTQDTDLTLPIAALGAAYLGAANLAAMHRAGLLPGNQPAPIGQLAGALRTAVGPTGAVGF